MTNTELTKIREEKKLSKSEFAKLLDITPMILGKYEKGSCKIPESLVELPEIDGLPQILFVLEKVHLLSDSNGHINIHVGSCCNYILTNYKSFFN